MENHETELSLLRNSRKDGMVSIDSELPFTNDDESESPAYLNESSDERENVYHYSKDVSYETSYKSIFWGMLNRDGKSSMKSGAGGNFKNLNETLTETNIQIDGVSTELKTDVPEVEKLINAGKYFFYKLSTKQITF